MSTFKANINVQKKITVNGVQYASLDEMPPDIRSLYEKAIAGGLTPGQHTTTKITINGQQYDSIDDVPAVMRPLVKGALDAATVTQRSNVATAVFIALVLLGVVLVLLRLR
jgi:hypothetical protein